MGGGGGGGRGSSVGWARDSCEEILGLIPAPYWLGWC